MNNKMLEVLPSDKRIRGTLYSASERGSLSNLSVNVMDLFDEFRLLVFNSRIKDC